MNLGSVCGGEDVRVNSLVLGSCTCCLQMFGEQNQKYDSSCDSKLLCILVDIIVLCKKLVLES